MRKHLLLMVCALVLASLTVGAQKTTNFKLGIKLSPNLCFINPSTKDYSSNGLKLGAVLGLVSDIYFAERYALSTGLNFSFLGGKISYPNKVLKDSLYVNGVSNSNMSAVYIEIPIMIKLFTKKFGNFSFFGQVGFGTGFRIAGTDKTDFTGDNGYTVSDKIDLSSEVTTVREAVLIGLGTEINVDQNTRIILGLGYSNSLNNILKGDNIKTGNAQKGYLNYIELNLGVMF
jgi:hypothetical protein